MSRPNTSTDTDTSERLVGCCSHCCTNISWTSAVSVPLQRQPQHPAFRVSPLEFFERQMRAVDDRLAQSECGLYESEVYQDMQQRFKEPKITKFLEHTRTVHSTAGRQYQKLKTAAQPATAVHVSSRVEEGVIDQFDQNESCIFNMLSSE